MTNKPAHVIRIASIKANIWEVKTKFGKLHNVKLIRVYKEESMWKETSSLQRDDLLTAAKVLDQAHTWICDQKTTPDTAPSHAT